MFWLKIRGLEVGCETVEDLDKLIEHFYPPNSYRRWNGHGWDVSLSRPSDHDPKDWEPIWTIEGCRLT